MPSFGETLQHFLFGSEIEVRTDNGDFTREANTIIDDFVANMSLSNTILKEYLNNKSTPKLESLMKMKFQDFS